MVPLYMAPGSNPLRSFVRAVALMIALAAVLGLAACSNNTPMTLTNRLGSEQSPYLLQHKDNPVHWQPWGDEAFRAAAALDRPIFLSIGYSTCHWCHVMERESFEDEEVAALMNETFISIKVDREERPDIDHQYMTVCQMMSDNCGWPLNVILTPDRKPFFATTYLPKEARFGRVGMLEFIPRIAEAWNNKREDVTRSAEQITQAIRSAGSPTGDTAPMSDRLLEEGFRALVANYDSQNAGFGRAPKFPSPQNLLFLLRYWNRTDDDKALEMVTHTLRRMRLGGIYDHVGFGFHRYSTDSTWTVPHFEKMLYDQAMLSLAYTEAWQATGDPLFRQTAEEILRYVERDMRDPEGGFYSAEDADSEGEEGRFYLWTSAELNELLGDVATSDVSRWMHVTADGNFEDEATQTRTGSNILYLDRGLEQSGAEEWEAYRRILFAARESRIRPGKDDKVLTNWNGLMIAAFARASRVFGLPRYEQLAVQATEFLLDTMLQKDGSLLHRWRGGEPGITGTASDYVYLTWGLIELYQTTFDTVYLRTAVDLSGYLQAHFDDPDESGLFMTSDLSTDLLARQKEIFDGAIPSSSSIAVWNLVRLGRMTGNSEFTERAERIGRFSAASASRSPAAFTGFLLGADMGVGPSYEVVLTGDLSAADSRAMIAAVNSVYIPRKVVLFREADHPDKLSELAPFTVNQSPRGGSATAYVCQNFVCNRPTTDISVLLEQLR